MDKTDHFLDGFFWAKSVAIVGATNNSAKTNYRLTQNLVSLGYKGKIFPVNPKEKEIMGVKAYQHLRDIPDEIDIVVVGIRPELVFDIVKECDELGIKRLVIVTGGFAEAGTGGKKLNEEIGAFVKAKGIRTMGPNTLTPTNTAINLVLSYFHLKSYKRGGLSFGFQSGFYEPKMNWIFSHLGVNKMLDMGNKIDVNEVDVLEYYALDPSTKVIAMHIESLQGDGRKFFKILKEVSQRKPTIILKAGRTAAGSKAAGSHTGSIARENDLIFDSMIRQTAAIRAQNVEEFFDLAKVFEYLDLPQGDRLAIMTMSGGEGVMATDASEMYDFNLADLGPETIESVKKVFPPWEIPVNPFDIGVSMQFHLANLPEFFSSLAVIPKDENVDCVVMQMPPNLFDFVLSGGEEVSDETQTLVNDYIQVFVDMKNSGKPFAIWRAGMDAQEQMMVDIFESHYVPVFNSSVRAVKAMAAMNRYRKRTSQKG